MAFHVDFQAAVLAIVSRIERAAAVQRSEFLVDAEFRIDFSAKHVSFALNFFMKLSEMSKNVKELLKMSQNMIKELEIAQNVLKYLEMSRNVSECLTTSQIISKCLSRSHRCHKMIKSNRLCLEIETFHVNIQCLLKCQLNN